MCSKIMEFHHSRKIPVFVQAQEIIDHENMYSIEEIVKTFDELSEYEKEIKHIKQKIKKIYGFNGFANKCNLKPGKTMVLFAYFHYTYIVKDMYVCENQHPARAQIDRS
ncbi:hypothetical protein ACFL0D_04980 [Thermoproteota archaeon]